MFRLLFRLSLSAILLALAAAGQSPARLSVQPGTPTPPAADGTRTALLVIRSVDSAVNPVVTAQTNLALAAHRYAPPGIVISEITLDAEEIEFVNTGGVAVDLGDWTLEAGRGELDSPNNRQRRILGPAFLPPGGTLVWSCRDDAVDKFPLLASAQKFARDGFSLVEVRDATGRLIDQAVFGFGGTQREMAWQGTPLTRSGAAGLSWHRGGAGNRFSRLDWSTGPSSIGSPDLALILPWLGSRISLPLHPATAVLTNGTWSGIVRFNPGSSAVWQVSASSGDGVFWESAPQPLAAPPALALEVVEGTTRGFEATPGRITTVRVRLPGPPIPDTEVSVALGWRDAGEFTAPLSVAIPAGESIATFGVTNLDDALADGRARVPLTASAPGYGPASLPFVNDDNESGQLQLSLPESASEGAGLLARGGTVFLPVPAVHDTEIELSAEGRVAVPAVVQIPAGSHSVSFPVWVLDDDRANLPPARDKVSARTSLWPSTSLAMRVGDDESLFLRLDLPQSVREGSPAVGRIVLGHPRDRDFVVELTSTESSLPLTGRLVVGAGQTEATFPVVLPDDQRVDSWPRAQICAIAESGGSACETLHLVDNDHPSKTLTISIPGPLFATEPARLLLDLTDAAGNPFPLTGPVTLRVVPSPGDAQLTPDSLTVPLVNGHFDGSIRFTGTGYGTVVEAAINGLVGTSLPIEILPGRVVGSAIADVAEWPGQASLLALRMQTNSGLTEGQLIELNPVDGATVRTLALPSPAHRLAVSANGAVAWIGSLSNSIQRVDLTAWKVSAELALARTNGVRRAMALAISPGGTEDVAVLTFPLDTSSGEPNRILAFRAGQRLEAGPTLDAGGYGADVVPGRAAGEFFAVCSKVVYRLGLQPEGLATLVERSLLTEPVAYVVHPAVVGDRLLLGNGGVLDVDTLQDLPGYGTGDYPPYTVVQPFPDADAVLYVNESYGVSTFNLTQRSLSGRRGLPYIDGLSAPPDRLVRSGTTGAALLSWTDQRLILLDEALRRPESADLEITIDTPASVRLSPEPFNVRVTVTNHGPDFAAEVKVQSPLGELAGYATLLPGEGRTAQLTVYPAIAGTLQHTVTVGHRGIDPVPGNNTAVGSTVVTASFEPGQIVLPFAMRHLIASPDGTRLFAAVGPEAAPAGIAELDPLTGERVRTLPVGGDPQRLKFTSDGRKILARIGTNQLVRWNLDSGAVDFDWSVENDTIVDFASLPEPRNRLAILNRRRLTILEGTNVVQTLTQPLDDERRIGVQGGRLWLARNGDLRAYKINPGNLTLDLTSSIYVPSGDYRFNADDERLYFAGRIHYPVPAGESSTFGEVSFIPVPGQVAYGISNGWLQRYDVSSTAQGFLSPQAEETILPLLQTGPVVDFVQCGSDGFAFRTGAGFLVITRTHLVPAASADLAVSLEAVGPTFLQTPSRFRVTVINRGPEAVSGFRLTVLGEGLENLSSVPPAPAFAGRFFVTHGELAAGASHSIEVSGFPVNYFGTANLTANVVGPTIDPAPGDNRAQLFAPVTVPAADLGIRVQLPIASALGTDFIARVEMTNRGPVTVLRPDLATRTFPTLELAGVDRGRLDPGFQGDVSVRGIQPALAPGSALAVDFRFRASAPGVYPLQFRPDAFYADPHPGDNSVSQAIRIPRADGSAAYPGFILPFFDAKWSEARNQWIVSDWRSLYFLAPVTLEVVGSVPLPGEFATFYLTDDGQHIWLPDGQNRATRYSLATGQPGLVVESSLDLSPGRGALVPVPGRPDVLVVFGLGPASDLRVVAYENGIALPMDYAADLTWQGRSLQATAGPGGRIYVSNGAQLRELKLEIDGLHFGRNLDAYERSGDLPMAVSGGLLLEGWDAALDLETLEFVNLGFLSRPNPGDIAYRRVEENGLVTAVEAYDCVRRRILWRQPLRTGGGSIFSGGSAGVLILGPDGGWLAAPPNPGVDLRLQATVVEPPLGAGQEFKVKLRVGTSGAWRPENLRIAAELSPGVGAIEPATDGPRWERSVQPGEWEVTFQAKTPGPQEIRFHVLADGVDPAPTDNEVVLRFTTPQPPVVLLEDLTVADNGQPFWLRLSTAAPAPLTVRLNAELIDAQAGDLTAPSYDVTFETGRREAPVYWIVSDNQLEPVERFQFSVVPGGLPAFPASAVISIANDDRIAIQARPVTQAEGNSGPKVAVLPVVLATSAPVPLEVGFSTVADSALPGEDFVPTSGTLRFAAGVGTNFITIPIVADLRFEPAEMFAMDFTEPSGLLLPATLPTVTLQNDDLPLAPAARLGLDAAGRLGIGFESELGARYSLQSRTNLTVGNWTSEPGEVIGVGGPMTISPVVRKFTETFFRVIAN